MNEILFNTIFDAYCYGDFKTAGLSPEDDPATEHNTKVLASEFGLNEDQELELSDLVTAAVCEAHNASFKNGMIVGAALERFLRGDTDKLLQSIAKKCF